MAGVEIVAVEWNRIDGVVLTDISVSGNWQKWIAEKMEYDVEDFDPVYEFQESAFPGVFMVQKSVAIMENGNPGACRILEGGSISESMPSFRGPGLVFGFTTSFGGRLIRLSGSQRVAIEAAAFEEWDVFRRAMQRMAKA